MKITEIASKLKPLFNGKDVKTSIAVAAIVMPLLAVGYAIALLVFGYVCVQSINLVFTTDISASVWHYMMLGLFLDFVLSAFKKK